MGDDVDDPMTAAELRVVREWLGLPAPWLAAHLQVAERAVSRWESGASVVPDGVRLEVERLERVTAEHVDTAVRAAEDARDPELLTYRTDADFRAHHAGQLWPASWHRAVCARVAHEVPGLVITYWAP